MKGLGSMMGEQPMEEPMQEPSVEGPMEANVSPEEQAIYDQVIANAYKIIYTGDTVSPQVLKGLEGSENPMMNLATTAVTLITGLVESAKKAGQPIPEDVLYHAGVEIVEELAEIAEADKIHEYSEEEIEQAFYLGLDLFRQSGLLDEEQLKQGFETIKQADQEGRLGEVLPGIEERMG